MEHSSASGSPGGHEENNARGRRRTRDTGSGDDEDGPDGDGGQGGSKKRRRSRKGLDKKFECPHEGCGKSYSRAEHLYRHQLNHNPKQIYNCDFPECHRSFVRQDLCARHKERHTARGSQLLRKENFMQNLNPIVTAAMQAQSAKLGKAQGSPTGPPSSATFSSPTSYPGLQQQGPDRGYPMQSPVASSATMRSENSTPLDPAMHSPATDPSTVQRSKSDDSYRSGDPGRMDVSGAPRSATFAPNYGQNGPRPHVPEGYNKPGGQNYGNNSPYAPPGGGNFPRLSQLGNHTAAQPGSNFQSHHNFPPLTALPPPGYATMTQQATTSAESAPPAQTMGPENHPMTSASDNSLLESMTPTYSIPMFGGESYSRSPFAMADDFTAWLFNDANFGPGASPMAHAGNAPGIVSNTPFSLQAPYFNHDLNVNGYLTQPVPPQHPMAVNNLIDTSMQQLALSEDRRQQILDLIDTRFNDTSHAPVKKRDELLDGNREDENHVLSLHMMQTYIGSYWHYFHPQMPILHKPTFQANSCPELLLIAIMALGASCLEKSHGYDVTQNCSELSNFLAWHLRWEIFMDADFRPPAKLWVFQALLLLEIFEKMYSTRPLHERAHIHHATTLTLMRRGSSLIGRSAVDSPPSGANSSHQSRAGSLNGTLSAAHGAYTPDEWWNQWITNEATRRAAFAAFVMDSIHATMFGHSAVMVAHEMRLPLPCDEALWSATGSAEVARVEANLLQNGVKPTTFLEGLKKTLNGQHVRTNSFGRTILMAGLLSVSWHMNQRDLQVSSLGVSQALGGRDKWRGSLTRAFDFWKLDLDESLAKSGDGPAAAYYQQSLRAEEENIFEGRTVLHHLAHMAMHVDIVDCQIFAGASRLLGRSITPQDYNGAQRRMKEGWAPTARARDATFYALRFLSQVLIPDDAVPGKRKAEFTYSARDDFLINRPWVLYFATLIVWSYGYALDGPIKPMYSLNSEEEVVDDMTGFLRRVGGVRAPDDLARVPNRNACLGLLILMRDTFGRTRWELLHEASKLLTKCVDMLRGEA
ncbi:hypothetical protein EJ06DRAFT_535918 [Trichodelitschia bisporula]|uniref:C2H2-type domain-containing protein n=1 Tax=Trichodelitschia bisporula TaxID=703511 RepID=A0A6G1I4Z2_9PEZI|nr:hypothetical protein EJ06DRAFT_535918 [Trichodelitschia bisporula]